MAGNPQTTAFLFPGQGSQALGMGREIAQASSEAAAVFAEADDVLGYSLSKLCWEGPIEALNETQHTQPALLTHSVAVLRALEQRAPRFSPAYAAGHSLGEFSALVAAGSLAFPEALRLVRERGLAMKSAGESAPGGMAAVLGLEAEMVDKACRAATGEGKGGVWVANDNCPGQIVISGDEAGLAEATRLLQEAGARKIVRLAVSIAAHSPLMRPAQTRFGLALDAANIEAPQLPVIGNVNASALRSAEEVRADLHAQLTANVRWTESMQALLAAGVTSFFEVGSGTVLCGLLRRIDREAACFPLDGPDTLAEVSG